MSIVDLEHGIEETAFADFVAFWEIVTGKNHQMHKNSVLHARQELEECEAKARSVPSGILKPFFIPAEERREIGAAQEKIPVLRAQIEDGERAQCENLVHSILTIPRVLAFECTRSELSVWTDTLYGLDPSSRQWVRIGRFKIMYTPSWEKPGKEQAKFDELFFWHNYDGASFIHKDLVPAPQVDSNGRRFCLGTAKAKLQSALHSGRLDLLVTTLVRYTECPHPSHMFGLFAPVSRSEVPEWYTVHFL